MPPLVSLTSEEMEQENVDPEDEISLGENLIAQRRAFLQKEADREASKEAGIRLAEEALEGEAKSKGKRAGAGGGGGGGSGSGGGGSSAGGTQSKATAKERKAAADKLRRERNKEKKRELERELEREQEREAETPAPNVPGVVEEEYQDDPPSEGE